MKRSLALVLTALIAQPLAGQQPPTQKKPLTLERLFAYPKLEGTAPERPKWSDDGRFVAFLWNDEGWPFRDLWLYDVAAGARRRLTRLPKEPDEWTATPATKDRKLRAYAPPDAGLSDFQWSPDSRRLAFELRGELYLVGIDGGPVVRLTRTKARESQPRFSPDGGRLAFVSGGELYVRDLTSGETRQLTSGGGLDIDEDEPARPGSSAGSYQWSPDGRWLAFESDRDTEVKGRLVVDFSGERVTSRRQNWRIAREGNRSTRLGLVPAEGGHLAWLTVQSDDYYVDWEWSPDASRIALLRTEQGQQRRHLDVIELPKPTAAGTEPAANSAPSASRGEPVAVSRTAYSESDDRWICSLCDFVAWSPDGRTLVFSSEQSGFNHLYLTAADGSTPVPRALTSGAWEITDYRLPTATTGDLQPAFSRDGRSIHFTASRSDPAERQLYRVFLADGRIEALTEGRGVNVGVLSKDGRRVAFLHSSFAEPWELLVKDVGAPRAEAVTRSPLPDFADYDWPQPQRVEFPSRDGRTLRALVFTPPGLTPEQIGELGTAGARARPKTAPGEKPGAHPVIVFVHGAGYAQAVLDRWGGYNWRPFQLNQYAAQQGYVVIDVDYRGSAGYGRDWRTDVYLHLGGKDMQDELAALDYLGGVSWADTSRAGVWGISYGGFMTLTLMFTAPDQFRAGSAWAAVSDWENYNRTYTQQRLRTPEEQPEAYRRSSPIHHVAGLKGALQLQHGILDDNVHFQDAAQLTDALVAAGKPFSQQFYPLEKHVWARPETWVHSSRSLLEFFDRQLR